MTRASTRGPAQCQIGRIADSLSVTITHPPGTVLYYTLNGSDPRLSDGSVSPDALVYDQGRH